VIVLAVAALVALVVGGGVALAALRWPRVDPASPTVSPVDDADQAGGSDADRVTILGLGVAALAVVACVTLFGLLFLAVRTRTGLGGVDLGSARWAARHANPGAANVLRVLTFLGSTIVALPLVLVVGVIEARRVPNRSIPAFLLLVEGGQLLLVNLVKVLVGRPRPDIDRLISVSHKSFPSGHSATAAATFAALVLLLGRRRGTTTRVVLAAAAAGLTALVASSRVLLGVHWVTDVLAGAALGWGWAALCSIAYGGRLLRFGAPLEASAPTDAAAAASGG